MDKKQNITNNIKVQNKDLEILKKHFSHCFDKNGNFDIEKFKQEISENEIDFYKESYGMDWLGKSYARLLASDSATTLLKEDEEFNQKDENKNAENLLVKGDNLEVLKHLSNAYYEKIKMIYIDPPYNTGSDGFVYQDDRKFSVSEFRQLAGVDEEKAKRILSFVDSKSNSHSAWLTFIYPRLYIAKHLLKDDGVIFVSIDDNEVAQLRLLMDEIFGEENFVNKFVWKKNSSGKTVSEKYPENIDYILMFSKTNHYELQDIFKPLAESTIKMYSKDDNDGRGKYRLYPLQKTGSPGPETTYDYIDNNGKVWKCPKKGWRINKNKMKLLENDNRLYLKNEKLNEKAYWDERENEGQIADTLWDDVSENNVGTAEVDKLLGKGIFTNPKPTGLIKRCIKTIVKSNDLILDFFAGSGTTGDAVMQLNAEDGGNRKYILVQLPEKIDPKKNKTAYEFVKDELGVDEPTIFEITKERLIRAAKKTQETIKTKIAEKEKEIKGLDSQLDIDNKDEKTEQLKAEIKALKNQDLGFKVFETMPIWEDYNFEADKLNEQTTLFDESKLNEDDLKALLVTWKTYDGISLTESLQEIDLSEYTAYYTSDKLYLINKGFKTENLKALLEKIDSDKKFNPTSIIAFGYLFESKNLREISENIKSYSNKKNIDIDFITRY